METVPGRIMVHEENIVIRADGPEMLSPRAPAELPVLEDPDMSPLPFETGPPLGHRSTLGLIVLQTDETIEGEFRRLLPDPDIALHVSRVPSGKVVTPQMLAQMHDELPAAAAVLPDASRFDAIAYCCTSGAHRDRAPERGVTGEGRRECGACHRTAERDDPGAPASRGHPPCLYLALCGGG